MASDFSNYLTASEYASVFVLYSIAICIIFRILHALYKRSKHIAIQDRNGLSNLLIANLICWAILICSALPHVAVMLAHWRPEGRLMNSYLIFWSTIITECMMAMIPYSLFFLTLDRIFSIQMLTRYEERHKMMMLGACIVTLLVIFAINMFAFCQIFPLPQQTDCNVFACLMTNGNTTFIVSKLFGGVTIIVAGIYFLVLLRKRTAKINAIIHTNNPHIQASNKIEPDTLVILIVSTEIALNFLPQLIIFIIQTMIGHQIASDVGPINHFLNCFDALISALTYRHTLRLFIKSESSGVMTIASRLASRQQQPQNQRQTQQIV